MKLPFCPSVEPTLTVSENLNIKHKFYFKPVGTKENRLLILSPSGFDAGEDILSGESELGLPLFGLTLRHPFLDYLIPYSQQDVGPIHLDSNLVSES